MSTYENHNQVELTDGQLEAAIKSDFNLTVTIKVKITEGFSNQVFSAQLGDEIVYIRMTKDTRVFPVEVKGYELFREHSIPVPNILAFQQTPSGIGIPTMIMEQAAGENVEMVVTRDPSLKASLFEKAGEVLRRIHEIKLEGYGGLYVEDNELRTMSKSWKEHLDNPKTRETYQYLLENHLVTDDEYEHIIQNYEDLLALNFESSSFLHNDFAGGHVYSDGKEITGVIDLGAALAGDPKHDIARSFLFMHTDEREYFAKGYGVEVSDHIIQMYLMFIAARMSAWRHKNNFKDGFTTGYVRSMEIVRECIDSLKIA